MPAEASVNRTGGIEEPSVVGTAAVLHTESIGEAVVASILAFGVVVRLTTRDISVDSLPFAVVDIRADKPLETQVHPNRGYLPSLSLIHSNNIHFRIRSFLFLWAPLPLARIGNFCSSFSLLWHAAYLVVFVKVFSA